MESINKDFEHLKIHLDELKRATNNFSSKVIGRGGFGKVYAGEVLHSKGRSMVAIKRLSREFGQGDPEFWKEIMMLTRYTHKNLISLLGYCDQDDEKILVYEYASNGSLDRHLSSTAITWTQRLKICVGVARALTYFHEHTGSQQRVIHRDIKSSNILLDDNWNAKLSDMGLSKLGPANQRYTYLYTRFVGTLGYCDPQYLSSCKLTKESDIYSFGVVLFEVLCGRLCFECTNNEVTYLVPKWKQSYKNKKLDNIIFRDLTPTIDPTSLKIVSDIAFECLHDSREKRPTASRLAKKLESALKCQETHVMKLTNAVGTFRKMPAIFPNLGRKNMCQQQRKHVPLEALVVERSNKLVLFDHDRNIHDFGLEDLLNGSAYQLGNGTVGTSYQKAIKAKAVVVKRLRDVVVSEKEFEGKMQVLGKMKNEYVVPLKGFYCSKYEKWVVYDYMPDGSLSARLHEMSFAGSTSSSRTQLDWEDRKRIALSTAKGLTYLHESGKIVHGNIKSSNILLRQETNYIDASVSDYGLNSLFGESSSLNHSVTGYWAPEVVMTKKVTFKSDVYSFGVLLLELLTGKTPNQTSLIEERLLFSKWVESIVSEKPKHEMFDVDLTRGIDHNIEEMEQLWHIAKDCVSIEPDKRPTMSDVVSTMEGMGLRPSSDDHSKGYDFTPSTDARDTPSTITP